MAADYRTVQTRMWREDEWFQSLSTEARLLWMYLFTNPSASVSGIYRLPLRTMAFESGLTEKRIAEFLRQFAAAGKAHYADGVVWVVKMRENQLPGLISRNLMVKIAKDVAAIPDGRVKRMYLERYGYPVDTVSIGYPEDEDTLSIPRATDTDTVTDTVTETETETETEQQPPDGAPPPSPSAGLEEKKTKPKAKSPASVTADASKPKATARGAASPYKDHPAVLAYRDTHNRWPQAGQMKLIAESNPPIGDWVRALTTWTARGYNPNNIEGVLEWAHNPAQMERPKPTPERNKQNGSHPHNSKPNHNTAGGVVNDMENEYIAQLKQRYG